MILPVFPVEGGCQCGAVRYRLRAAPLGVYACHCKDCQRFSGTTHTLSMVVKADDVELIAGELTGFDKAADSGRTVRMLGCLRCGTKVWNEPLASPHLIIMKPGTASREHLDGSRPVMDVHRSERPQFPRPADRPPAAL